MSDSTPIHALFLVKEREDFGQRTQESQHPEVATGMKHSAEYLSTMILDNVNVISSVVRVVDNSSQVSDVVEGHSPTHVFVEGYWIAPMEFDSLKEQFPSVRWIVRYHGELPFLAKNAAAISWTIGYVARGVQVAPNSPRLQHDLRTILGTLSEDAERDYSMLPLLPNYYPTDAARPLVDSYSDTFHVGCFGAIRPLKNTLSQAAAAIAYSDQNNLTLKFHVNAGQIVSRGLPVFENLKSLFTSHPRHELVTHPWMNHGEFLLLCRQMDLCMQVSFTEAFNQVTADAILSGVPVLTSPEVPYLYPVFANPNSVKNMIDQMDFVLSHRYALRRSNLRFLDAYNHQSRGVWTRFLNGGQPTHEDLVETYRRLLPPAKWTWNYYRACAVFQTVWSSFTKWDFKT